MGTYARRTVFAPKINVSTSSDSTASISPILFRWASSASASAGAYGRRHRSDVFHAAGGDTVPVPKETQRLPQVVSFPARASVGFEDVSSLALFADAPVHQRRKGLDKDAEGDEPCGRRSFGAHDFLCRAWASNCRTKGYIKDAAENLVKDGSNI